MGGLSVWAVIVPPDYAPPEVSSDFQSTVDELPTVTLVDEDPSTKMLDGTFTNTYDDFAKNGDYTVIFYAKDSENNLVKSAPVTITVSGGVDVATTTTTTGETTTTSTTVAPTTTSTTVAPTTTTSTSATTTTTTIPPSGSVTLPVGQGWSLLSSTIGFQVATLFGDNQKFTSVWKWVGGAWAVYLPGEQTSGTYATSKGFSQLAAINPGEGFWVNATGSSSVSISGTPVYGDLTFTNGWNLLGLKSAAATTVADFIVGKSGIISLWKWENGTWSVYLPAADGGASYATSKGFGQITTIAPKEGFWVNKQ